MAIQERNKLIKDRESSVLWYVPNLILRILLN